jgi:two-component system, sensor histidine kinase and response regulator
MAGMNTSAMPCHSLLDMHSDAPATPSARNPHRTLLIVDDEEGPRQSLRVVFKDDYKILLAEDGSSAITLAGQTHLDAAVLDIRLSDMTGIELLMYLKQIDPAIEVVMLTAYETPETTRQALRYGACDYLNKPFDIPAMRDAVARAMQRRALSDEMRTVQRQLEQLKSEVRNQTTELETGRTRVEIYASILHDINSPLTYIATAVEQVTEQLEQYATLTPLDQKEIRSKLDLVQRYASNCGEIARRYLQFLRRRSPEHAVVSLKTVLDDLPHLMRVHSRQGQHHLEIELPSPDVRVRINGTDLIQILVNLVKNAIQSAPSPRRIAISSRLLKQPLNWEDLEDESASQFVGRDQFVNTPPILALTVTDDGPGIPPELMSKIFTSYFSTKPEGEGVGIGLNIVQRLIGEAHGALHVRSQPGQGTQFTVFLGAFPPID